jgi:hypothetical protein
VGAGGGFGERAIGARVCDIGKKLNGRKGRSCCLYMYAKSTLYKLLEILL